MIKNFRMVPSFRKRSSSIGVGQWYHMASNRLLDAEEVRKILEDVKADDIRIIPSSPSSSSWTDFMIVASGRSPWHVRNIAQALIHSIKEKQQQQQHGPPLLPRVQGYQAANWIVVDAGNVVVHALDEKARRYYDLEHLWAERASTEQTQEDLYLLREQSTEEEGM